MSPQRDSSEDTPTTPLMTQIQMEKLLRKIDRALSGDPYNQEEHPGFLNIMLELHKDYYGDKRSGRLGTKDMVTKLWEMRIKIFALCTGASVVAWVLEMLIQYHSSKP